MRDEGLTADLRLLTSQKSDIGGGKEASRYTPRGTSGAFVPLTLPVALAISVTRVCFRQRSTAFPTGRLATKNTVFSSRILRWTQVRKQVGKLSLFCAIAGWIREPNCA